MKRMSEEKMRRRCLKYPRKKKVCWRVKKDVENDLNKMGVERAEKNS
jgi:hypothetical protein